jgi:hypothetical protein
MENMLGYTNFNRHKNMDGEMLREVGSLIDMVQFGPNGDDGVDRHSDDGFNLINELYGLYDGYLYDDLLVLGKNLLNSELLERLTNVVKIVEKYPKI